VGNIESALRFLRIQGESQEERGAKVDVEGESKKRHSAHVQEPGSQLAAPPSPRRRNDPRSTRGEH
jgi:hypothetical protein